MIYLMAKCCRLCFVRFDRCYDEPSGAVMDLLQAFAVTRHNKNAQTGTKYAVKSPRCEARAERKWQKPNF